MKTIRQLAEEIVDREGGFVNDPDDPGGATKHGVTLGTLRRLGIDVTHDAQIDIADVKALSRAQSVEIYIEHYYRKPGFDQLPAALQPGVFDMYVNAGANAIKVLQRMVTQLGFPCATDGQLGPKTLYAVGLAHDRHPEGLADAYAIARRNYYYALADARPASRKFARRRDGGKGGWITRAEEFMSPQLRLTDAQHRARVAAWG